MLMLLSADNVEAIPVWQTAHEKQLDFSSGNHKLYVVEGSHYIWYTSLERIKQLILSNYSE